MSMHTFYCLTNTLEKYIFDASTKGELWFRISYIEQAISIARHMEVILQVYLLNLFLSIDTLMVSYETGLR